MYTALFHTHRLVVSIFLALYFVKMILLLMNKHNQLDSFRRWTKIPEIIVSVLFLGTGIWMLAIKPSMSYLQVIKLAAVVVAIPLGVIGFGKSKKLFGVLSFVCLVAAYGLAEMGKKIIPKATLDPELIVDAEAEDYNQIKHGNALYDAYCKSCHGADGKLNLAGAFDLTTSELGRTESLNIILNGRGRMPAFRKVLSPRDAEAVQSYVETLSADRETEK